MNGNEKQCKGKIWQKELYKPVAVAVRLRSTPMFKYVVTCNIFMLYCSWQSYLRTYLLNSFISHDNAPNSISAGVPTQTPLGELTALPQTPWLDSRGSILLCQSVYC